MNTLKALGYDRLYAEQSSTFCSPITGATHSIVASAKYNERFASFLVELRSIVNREDLAIGL